MTKLFVYKTTPSGALYLEALYPAQQAPERPAILFLFGGGWVTGHRQQFLPQARFFASRGWLSVVADYRVASRHGSTPQDALADARDAWAWLQSRAGQFDIDPRQMVLAGGSSGGHLAACMASGCGTAPLSPPPRALVLYNPVLDLVAARPQDGFSTGEMDLIRQMTAEERERLSPWRAPGHAPGHHSGRAASQPLCELPIPRLLIYGDQDPLYRHYLTQPCGDAGEPQVPLGVATWEGVGHGFFNEPPYTRQTNELIADFLQRSGRLNPQAPQRDAANANRP
ncbi:alpha/beta hydrolase [Parahaliea mediterranea]|uniref:alpha/beta hydrolase n=1 Tax=Parahaliea mediterranea TaxID=651086 RepID=UPI001300A514|nr:alpha/beta hydrolase [Parahaliea mediterranea]